MSSLVIPWNSVPILLTDLIGQRMWRLSLTSLRLSIIVTQRALSGLKLFLVLRVTFSMSMEMIFRFCSNSLALFASMIFLIVSWVVKSNRWSSRFCNSYRRLSCFWARCRFLVFKYFSNFLRFLLRASFRRSSPSCFVGTTTISAGCKPFNFLLLIFASKIFDEIFSKPV